MDTQTLATAFQFYTITIVLVVVLLWQWPSYRLDGFRQEMFSLRDELFDYAYSGKIGFDDPAYRLLRQLMNGFIRYAHRLTFFRVCMNLVVWKTVEVTPELKWTDRWNRARGNIKNEDAKKSLDEFHGRVCALVVGRLASGSPVLLALITSCIVVALCHAGLTSLKEVFDKAVTETLTRIIDSRLLDEEAAKAAA